MRHRTRLLIPLSLLLLVATSCNGDDELLPDGTIGGGEGDTCTASSECSSVLVCAGDGTCQRPGEPGTRGENEGCATNDDCQVELVCNSTSRCSKPGTGVKGTACTGNQDCGKGLLCSSGKQCAAPGDPGTKVEGDACTVATDCALGLRCLDEKCVALSFWEGASCQVDNGKLRAYFEVPRGANKLSDFYRLPFPNDIRLKGGTVDVTSHPDPGVVLPPPYNKVVQSLYDEIKKSVSGFGVNTGIYFRFSAAVDLNTLTLQGTSPTVSIVDITKGSPGYGQGASIVLGAYEGRGLYICENWMVIRPSVGQPLRSGTTYAVILRKGIKSKDGATDVAADSDFEAMLRATPPADPDLKRAWDAYQVLRDFAADRGLSDVIGAAVFTTMDPRRHARKFREAVYAQPAPQLGSVTLCNGATKSPCDNGKDTVRTCPTSTNGRFDEVHALYDTPVAQRGTPPYTTPADGGDIVYDAEGRPVFNRNEQACLAMSVPKGTMPPNGWPVVVFAHGTGGSLRTFINNGTAEALAAVRDDSGADISQMAVVSIDGSMHGPRAGTDDPNFDPGLAFFNLLNPKAARDNVYQAAIDKLVLVRLIKTLDLAQGQSPTGQRIKFDTSKIYFFGHSQGAIEGPPMLIVEPDIKGAVLSGAGGYLIASLLEKRKPFDIATLVQVALADPALSGSSSARSHPLLNMLQLFFEEVDTVNYGSALFARPETGVEGKHIFMSYGSDDHFTPPSAIEALARVTELALVNRCGDGVCTGMEDCRTCGVDCPSARCEERDTSFGQLDAPVSGNTTVAGGKKLTTALVRFKGAWTSDDDDDHFALFRLEEGRRQSTQFLGTAARDGVPTIPADK